MQYLLHAVVKLSGEAVLELAGRSVVVPRFLRRKEMEKERHMEEERERGGRGSMRRCEKYRGGKEIITTL